MSNSHAALQEGSDGYFLGHLTQKERQENNGALEAVIRHSITTLFSDENPKLDIDGCLGSIRQGYDDPRRAFHDFQHIFQILPPTLQDKIIGAQGEIAAGRDISYSQFTTDEMQIVVSTAYHDARYNLDSSGIKDIKDVLESNGHLAAVTEIDTKGNIINSKEAAFSDIKAVILNDFRESDINLMQQLFGFEENSKFTVGKMSGAPKLDGAPMNEFLSALTAVRDLAPDGIDQLNTEQKQHLFQTLIDIQMTVPFQKDHALHLFENAGKIKGTFGVGDDNALIPMVNHAVDISNRDIGNLLHKDFIHMLSGDYVIAAEFRAEGTLNNELPISDLYSSVTNAGFAGFVLLPALSEDRLVQPRINGEEDGRVSLIKNDEKYLANTRNAQANIETALLTASVMGAAITLLCAGQEETDKLCGYTGTHGNCVVYSRAQTHLIAALDASAALPEDKRILPDVLLDSLQTALRRYSVAELKTLKDNGGNIVRESAHKDSKISDMLRSNLTEPTTERAEIIIQQEPGWRAKTWYEIVTDSIGPKIDRMGAMLPKLSGHFGYSQIHMEENEGERMANGHEDLTSSITFAERVKSSETKEKGLKRVL